MTDDEEFTLLLLILNIISSVKIFCEFPHTTNHSVIDSNKLKCKVFPVCHYKNERNLGPEHFCHPLNGGLAHEYKLAWQLGGIVR